jgi:hypothetical protein
MHSTVNIQSISDVITNSSSEIFTVTADYDAAERLEEIIDKLLNAAGSQYCCGDLFDISTDFGAIQVKPRGDNPDVKVAATYLEFIQDLFYCEEK